MKCKENRCGWCQPTDQQQASTIHIRSDEGDSFDVKVADGALVMRVELSGADPFIAERPIKYCPMCGRRFRYDA